MKIFHRIGVTLALLLVASPALATVTVTSPAAGATVTSPVHYVATATTTTCSKGVGSMGIYVDNKLVYTVNGTSLNTELTLAAVTVRVDDAPEAIEVGFAPIVTVGTGFAVTVTVVVAVALPPVPVAVAV
jgi:hypothetical protein